MIVWVDLETSGLDPRSCCILEIAVVATDDDLNEICEPFSSVVMPLPGRGIEAMDDYVIAMHEKNGLLAEVYELSWKARGLRPRTDVPTYTDVLLKLEDWLSIATTDSASSTQVDKFLRSTPLAGSSVHFDRKFMEQCGFERFANLFSHRHFDVSAMNEAAKRWAETCWRQRPGLGPDSKPVDVAHRALADIRASIEVAKHYRDRVWGFAERGVGGAVVALEAARLP